MIYTSISVEDTQNAISFYTETLGVFDVLVGHRLTCNNGNNLTIDLYKIGSERHLLRYGLNSHVPIHIGITHDRSSLEMISNQLNEHEYVHELKSNIAGDFLELSDPTGNRISLIGK